jgi:methylated-DNA-[protein]-cysteine S-methyltransferase
MKELLTIASMAQSRLGPIWLVLSERGLIGLHMRADEDTVRSMYSEHHVVENPGPLKSILAQLGRYFDGERLQFEASIDWTHFSPFQRQVLQHVCAIGYGHTRTYQDIATEIGKPGAARAVGRANATNPIPIIIPCHRVLGADGKLHGYGGPGGVETKAWLLRLEGSRLL